jgi:hypothetical protein
MPPVEFPNVPCGQNSGQEGCPASGLKEPALQGVQAAALRADSFSDAVPGGHGVHAEEPGLVEKDPEGHAKQAALDELPLAGL